MLLAPYFQTSGYYICVISENYLQVFLNMGPFLAPPAKFTYFDIPIILSFEVLTNGNLFMLHEISSFKANSISKISFQLERVGKNVFLKRNVGHHMSSDGTPGVQGGKSCHPAFLSAHCPHQEGPQHLWHDWLVSDTKSTESSING